MKSKTRIWLGVGAAIFVAPAAGASEHSSQAAAARQSAVAMSQKLFLAQAARPGGEAGEAGGEKGSAAAPAADDFVLKLAQLRGQLLVGDELVKQAQWDAALPHFQHALDKIYPDIRSQLRKHKVAPFDNGLQSLVRFVKAKKGTDDYARAYAGVQNALSSADKALAAKDPDWAGYVVETAVDLALAAADEYKRAVSGGAIKNLAEYHDVRGFLLQAEQMIESVASALEKKDPDALTRVRALFAELKAALPLMPPNGGVREVSWILGNVSRVELAAGRLMQ